MTSQTGPTNHHVAVAVGGPMHADLGPRVADDLAVEDRLDQADEALEAILASVCRCGHRCPVDETEMLLAIMFVAGGMLLDRGALADLDGFRHDLGVTLEDVA